MSEPTVKELIDLIRDIRMRVGNLQGVVSAPSLSEYAPDLDRAKDIFQKLLEVGLHDLARKLDPDQVRKLRDDLDNLIEEFADLEHPCCVDV